MDISIIIPIYNVEKYVEECINSVINQSIKKNIEIILVNDGSTDLSRSKIEKYKLLDNIKIIDKENGGLSSARNIGICEAIGKYIVFIDSDDFIEKNFLEKLYNYINDNDLDIVFSGYSLFYEKGYIKKINNIYNTDLILNKEEAIKNLMDKRTFRAEVWDDIYKREFLLKNNILFEEGIINEDEDFTLRVILKSSKVGYLNNNGYMYRQREGSITKSFNYKKNIESRLVILNKFIDIYEDEDTIVGKKLVFWRIKCLICLLVKNINISGLKYDIDNILKFIYKYGNIKDKLEINIIRHRPKIYIIFNNIKSDLKRFAKKKLDIQNKSPH